jgi:hypothetical protein
MPETSDHPIRRDQALETATMTTTSVQQTARPQAFAAAPRLGSAVLSGRSLAVCSWPVANKLGAEATIAGTFAFATKPATRMYVDAMNHRTRRLTEPSP